MISQLPQILPKQNTDFVHFLLYQYFKLAFDLSFIAWQKKPYLAKALTEPINLMALLSAPNANFACNSQAAIDSALIQWHTGIVRLTVL